MDGKPLPIGAVRNLAIDLLDEIEYLGVYEYNSLPCAGSRQEVIQHISNEKEAVLISLQTFCRYLSTLRRVLNSDLWGLLNSVNDQPVSAAQFLKTRPGSLYWTVPSELERAHCCSHVELVRYLGDLLQADLVACAWRDDDSPLRLDQVLDEVASRWSGPLYCRSIFETIDLKLLAVQVNKECIRAAAVLVPNDVREIPVTPANDARDKWLYELRKTGTTWKAIEIALREKIAVQETGPWEVISTSAIRQAVGRYVERHRLPDLPQGKRGRPVR